MTSPGGWGPRDRRAADRMGGLVMLGGALLHGTLLLWLGTPAFVLAVGQWLGVAAKLAAAGWAARDAGRLPRWLWPATMLVVQPLFCLQLLVLDDEVLLAAPLLVMITVFASHWLGRSAARAVVAESVVLAAVTIGPSRDDGIGVVAAVFVAGVLLVLHLLLAGAADEHELLVASLTRTARTDPLTGLLNRGAFDTALAVAGPGSSLLVVDVDRFKAINDTHGHPVGDRALQLVAGALAAGVRDADAVVGRLGGDEFAVLLARCPAEVAVRRAAELTAAVAATPLLLEDGRSIAVGVSIGVASGVADLYGRADQSLYEVKGGA